jgi:predicted component of type VI protein secretion system
MMLMDTYLDSYNVVPWCLDVQWGITQATLTQNYMAIGRIVLV